MRAGEIMRPWLKMQIITKFGNQTNFARACNKSDAWLSRIVAGRKDPSKEDKNLILKTLQVNGQEDHLFWSLN